MARLEPRSAAAVLHRVFVASVSIGLATLWVLQHGAGRQLLWPTVEICRLSHKLLGIAAPCLAVTENSNENGGYAILRGPVDQRHVILTPLVHIAGIEASQLRSPHARNYVAAAWSSRRFAYPPDVPPPPVMGLAINSQRGRTQDQLHIHIDCALSHVMRRLKDENALLQAGRWIRIDVNPEEEPYAATSLGDSLDNWNVVDLAASHLKLSWKDMPQLTLAVFAIRDDLVRPGFVLLARKDRSRQHAELLLDHNCAEYRELARVAETRLGRQIEASGVRFASPTHQSRDRSQ